MMTDGLILSDSFWFAALTHLSLCSEVGYP